VVDFQLYRRDMRIKVVSNRTFQKAAERTAFSLATLCPTYDPMIELLS
jgi:hypothetical protein